MDIYNLIKCSAGIVILLLAFSFSSGCKKKSTTIATTGDKLILQQLIPVPFNKVNLNDNFWLPRLQTQAKTLVPFALDKTKPAVENLKKAGDFLRGDTTDLPFPHRFISSDLYKVMEGAALILMENPNPILEERIDSIIDIIADAQKEDGYLYVAHITGVSKDHEHWGGGGMGDKPYTFVVHSHELYNMGHMYEAAIAYYQATGKDKWLNVAVKNANHINKVFFEGDPEYNNGKPINQAPGHQEIELALVKLYQITENELYLEMAQKFLDIRGITYQPDGDKYLAPTYAQQHKPIKEQNRAVGHAVRATYMYTGMADVASITGSDAFSEALYNIWNNIVDTKMHITGGLGAMHGIEGFGPEYILPNKEAYNETCAAVGNVFFNHRMCLMNKDAAFMDVAEVALYNNVLAGVNMEGNEFFYVNPLEADGITTFNHGRAGRSPWFGTACCPSNLARLIPQVSGMMYAHNTDEIYTLLYGGSSTTIHLSGGSVEINQNTEYPFDESINLIITPNKEFKFTLKLRIPTWLSNQFVPGKLYRYLDNSEENWTLKINNQAISVDVINGFISINRVWSPGDEVELYIPMPVRFNTTIDSVKSNIDRLSITKGPLVYCAEEKDNNTRVQNLYLNKIPSKASIVTSTFSDENLKNIDRIDIPGNMISNKGEENRTLKLIPYFAWNNRGNESMIVWLPRNRKLAEMSSKLINSN